MNKRLNTLLFLLGATVFNVLVAVLSFIILFVLYANFLSRLMPETTNYSWVFAIIFLGSLAISFVTYRYALKFLLSKIDVDKYFDSLLVKKYKKRR
jgi:hypothetical protein